jgi:hypothetical protein
MCNIAKTKSFTKEVSVTVNNVTAKVLKTLDVYKDRGSVTALLEDKLNLLELDGSPVTYNDGFQVLVKDENRDTYTCISYTGVCSISSRVSNIEPISELGSYTVSNDISTSNWSVFIDSIIKELNNRWWFICSK